MTRRLLLPSMILAVALAAGCGGDDGPKTFDDPRGPLAVKAGEEFRLALAENPSTGYLWRFGRRPDPAVVSYEGSEFELEEGGEDRAGAGGTRTLRFQAVKAGRTAIVLENVGPSGGEPVSVRRISVRVSAD